MPEQSKTNSDVVFTSSGSTLLDLALGGGWAQGRMTNIVGDKSSGKSLAAIEALANHAQVYPLGLRRYGEAEAAFDALYARNLGFPSDVERPDVDHPLATVEDFQKDVQDFISRAEKTKQPCMYILDSADALSSKAELDREMGESTYGVEKAKAFSELFRRMVKPLEAVRCTLIIISQVRENIGVTFGDHYTRSGGKALDFYASQICWLAHMGKLERTIKGNKLVEGVSIKANVKKSKVGLPFRTAEMSIIFGYGIDDEQSMIDWLGSTNAYSKEEVKAADRELDRLKNLGDRAGVRAMGNQLTQRVTIEWQMIEAALAPKIKKYGADVPPVVEPAKPAAERRVPFLPVRS